MSLVALLCWEAGAGLGHLVHLVCLARALKARGWTCVLALKTGPAPTGLDYGGMPVCQAPHWGEASKDGLPPSRSSASLGDMLAELGLCSEDAVARQIAAWERLFAEYRPDLVAAEYAPGAVLAARGRLPCVTFGAGFSVPPAGLARFPPLHHAEPIRYDEATVRDTVNAALARFHIQPIERLSDTLTGDAACACTLPLIDPYAPWRDEPAIGAIFPDPVIPRAPDADGIFCYLRPGPRKDFSSLLAKCLKDLPMRVTAYLPSLEPAESDALRQSGVEMLERTVALTQPIAHSRLVLHGGGHGLATAAVTAGVTQIILDIDIEKRLTADLLARRGIGRRMDPARLDPEILRMAIMSALNNRTLEAEVLRAAEEHSHYRDRDVAGQVAERCASLL